MSKSKKVIVYRNISTGELRIFKSMRAICEHVKEAKYGTLSIHFTQKSEVYTRGDIRIERVEIEECQKE
jgi:hypothetical protein